NDAFLNPIGIDFHRHRCLWFSFLCLGLLVMRIGLVLRLLLSRALFFLFLFLFFLFLFLFLFSFFAHLVTTRRQRRLRLLGQHDKVNALHVPIDSFKFFLAKNRFEIASRREHQIFSVIAESDT